MTLDKYPSTPVKAIWAQLATIIFFGFSLWLIARNITINEFVYGIMAGAVLGSDITAVAQFGIKRRSAWQPQAGVTSAGEIVPVTTESEAKQATKSGQPATPLVVKESPPVAPAVPVSNVAAAEGSMGPDANARAAMGGTAVDN